MEELKRKRLEAAGYHVGTVAEALTLTPAESALVELRLSLMFAARRLRSEQGLSQAAAAKRVGVTQPQIARAEGRSGRESAGLDLSFKVLFGLGGTLADLKPIPEYSPNDGIAEGPEGQTRPRTRRTRKPLAVG